MNHCGTYTIETKRLLLREFMVEDAEGYYDWIWKIFHERRDKTD